VDSAGADVVFLSYQEPNAEENFARLRFFAPHAKRVRDIEGIYNAYQEAARIAETPSFFLVDGDNWIVDGFDFLLPRNVKSADIYFWRARNAVNGLELMNGSVKLLSRNVVATMEKDAVDFSAAMKGTRVVINRVASETRFNATPFLAWRCGFRECAKFLGGLVDNPNVPNIVRVWQTVGEKAPNGRWCMLGARMGAAFGEKSRGTDALKAINDMAWLEQEFERVRANAAAR